MAATNKVRTIKARLAVLLVAAVEILGIFGNLKAHADEVTIDNVQQKVQEAAIAHVVANTMKKCVNSINSVYAWSWNGTFPKDEVYTSQKGLFGGTTNIAVGPWLENRIQNKVDDGDIWCSNENGKIVSEFANAVGVSTQQVICGLDDQGGLMLGYTEDNLNSQSATCSGGERFYKNSNATAKLQQIYDAYAANNPYAVSWDNLGSFDQVDGYYLYLNDLQTMCTGGGNNLTYTKVNAKAGLEETTITVNNTNINKNINSFVSGQKNCSELATKVTEYAPIFQAEVKKKLNDSCKDAVLSQLDTKEQEAQEIVNNPSNYSADDVQKAQDLLAEIQAARTSSDYLEGDDTNGYTCKTVAGITVTQEEGADPAEAAAAAGSTSESEPTCWNSGESLGWILCPVLDITSNLLKKLYTHVFQDFLQVKASMLTEDSARQAWQTFQTFANIIFVILLLAVIISQLTGVGIDNLGIKRILPRLITAAILVNISYILCMLAVDVSNIIGQGIYGLFNAMSDGVTVSDPSIGAGVGVGTGVLTLIIGGIIAGGFWVAYGGIAGIILAIVPVVIAGVISLLFTLILLGARQAGVLILTVISPIAVVMYMLPNTRKFFDRWTKMFSGLLMLYPIVGALVGGSNFASALLLSVNAGEDQGFFFLLTAMLINIVPFFFIPTLLRGSFAAMGNIGNRIGSLGQRLGGRASSAVRRNESYRNAQDLARAGYKYDRQGRLVRRGYKYDKDGNLIKSRIPNLSNSIRDRAIAHGGVIGRAASRSLAKSTEDAKRIGSLDARADAINDRQSILDAQANVKVAKSGAKAAKADLRAADENVRLAEVDLAAAQKNLSIAQSNPNASQATLNAAQMDVQVMQDALNQRRQERAAALTAHDAAIAGISTAKAGVGAARLGRSALAGSVIAGARNTATVQGIAERGNLARMSKETAMSSRLATLENTEANKNIEDIMNLIASGKYRDSQVNGGNPINVNDIDMLNEAFYDAFNDFKGNPNDDENKNRVYALAEMMFSKGNPGRSAYNQTLRRILSRGTDNSAEGAQALNVLASHIYSKYGNTMHSVDRGSEQLHLDLARNGTGAKKDASGQFDMSYYSNYGLGSYTAEKFNDADDIVIDNVLRDYETGVMSNPNDRAYLEQLTHTITTDDNMKSRVKGSFKNRIQAVANNYAAQRTTSVDQSGIMRETAQRVNGSTDTQLIQYTTRAGAVTSNINDVHQDFQSAWQELNSGISSTTGQTLTAGEKQSLQTTISSAKATLDKTTEGAEMVRNDLLSSVATQTAASGSTPVTITEEGTKYVASLVSKSGEGGRYNSTLAEYARTISSGGEVKHTDFTQVTNANGTTSYSLVNNSSAPQTIISNTGGAINDSTPIVTNTTLDNGQTHQQTITFTNSAGATVPLTVGDVKARIQANIDVVNNSASTTDQIEKAKQALAQDAKIMSSSAGGMEQIRDFILQNYTAQNGNATQTITVNANTGESGLRVLTAQLPVDQFDSGFKRLADEIKNQNQVGQGSSYQGKTEVLYDRFTGESVERREGVAGQSEYYQPGTNNRVATNPAEQERYKSYINAEQNSQLAMQLNQVLNTRLANHISSGTATDGKGFVRDTDPDHRDTFVLRDASGKIIEQYNTRTGVFGPRQQNP